MRRLKWGFLVAPVAAVALAAGGGTVVTAQQPSPTPGAATTTTAPATTSAPAAAQATPTPPPAAGSGQAATPPNRFYGTASLDGRTAADGTTVVALIGSTNCGTGSVQANMGGMYVVDVASSFTRPGCGMNGDRVTFTVGGAPARETGTFQTGAFTQLNLTATAATPTPPPPPPTVTRTATPPPPPTVTRTATPPPPTVTRTPVPATPPSQRPAAAAPAPQRPAGAAAGPIALPRTGVATSDNATAAWLAFAALAAIGSGAAVVAARKR